MKLAPGPSTWTVFRRLLKIRRDPFEQLKRIREEYGDFLRVRMPYVAHLVCHPDHMEHIYLRNAKNYLVRGKEFYEVEPLLGQGVLLSNGDLWAKQRRTISKEFTPNTVKGFAPAMLAHVDRTIARWEREGDVEREMTDEMMTLTLGIAAEVFFGTAIENAIPIAEAVDLQAKLAAERIRAFIKLPRGCPIPGHRKVDKAIARMDKIIYRLISDYRKEGGRTNVLTRLMDSRGMSDKLLRDEIVTLLISGHETTASLLFWTFYLLDRNPPVRERLEAEVKRYDGDLEAVPYVKWVLQETLRMYPAFANLSKTVAKDDEIDGCFIPGGSLMNVCVYLTHYHPEFWPDPERFDPERFSPERSKGRHPFSWLPFGRGPRACIGEHFAMLEAQLLLIRLVQRFRFHLVPGHVVKPVARITIFPQHGIRMRVTAS